MNYTIFWTPEAEQHLRRSDRYPGDLDITTTMVDEVLADPELLVYDPDPKTRSGDGVRFVGYSASARGVLVVIAIRMQSELYGATAFKTSSGPEHKEYLRKAHSDE